MVENLPRSAALIASDMEDNVATIREIAIALQLIGRNLSLTDENDVRAVERIAVVVEDRARALEQQRLNAVAQQVAQS
jgi:hypothetical protein